MDGADSLWGARLANVIKELHRDKAKVIGIDFLMAADPDSLIATELDKALDNAHVSRSVALNVSSNLPPALQPWKTFVGALEEADGSVLLADHPLLKNAQMDLLRYNLDATQGCLGNAILPSDLDGAVWRVPLYTRLVYNGKENTTPEGEAPAEGKPEERPSGADAPGSIKPNVNTPGVSAAASNASSSNAAAGEKGEEVIIPGFAALIAARASGIDPHDEAALRRMGGLPLGQATINTDVEFGINYIDTNAIENLPYISARRVANGELTQQERALLRDAVVMVGSTYNGNEDTHYAPRLQLVNGVDIQAQAVATLLDGKTLHRWTRGGEALATLLIGILAVCFVIRLPIGRGGALVVAAELTWFLIVQGFFDVGGRMLPQTGPALALLLPFVSCHLMRSLEEARRRHKIEEILGRTVSPAIADHLMSNPGALELGGKRIEGSVLFFDIRGSSAFAQYQPAETVFAEYNGLFGVVVPEIEKHGGLLYRYLGDGFMAVFGVPTPLKGELKDHRQAAVRAAFAAIQAVHARNAVQPRIDGQPWRVGCGVHTGELAYGNLGQEERSEFTVIGDTINVAARLESMNKKLNSEIVFSAATLADVPLPPGLRGPVDMPVDGKVGDMPVYYKRQEEAQASEES